MRLIDADKLVEVLKECKQKENGLLIKKMYDSFIKIISMMPTVDAVEVVRCKDCKFNVGNMKKDPLDATDYSDITCSYFMTDGMEPDDFCSRGAKMDGGDK